MLQRGHGKWQWESKSHVEYSADIPLSIYHKDSDKFKTSKFFSIKLGIVPLQ